MAGEIITSYVLHTRDYHDSSLIADLYSLEQGRISAVFKGARAVGKRRQNIVEPFRRLSVSMSGRGALKTAFVKETQLAVMPHPGVPLFSAFYVNELLVRLVREAEANIELFAAYEWVLTQLQAANAPDDALRSFEYLLLQHCGSGIDFDSDVTGADIQANGAYSYQAGQGFVPSLTRVDNKQCFQGEVLQAIKQQHWSKVSRLAAKFLNRAALQHLLGDKPLASRRLFQKG